jgi:hypothetical protein
VTPVRGCFLKGRTEGRLGLDGGTHKLVALPGARLERQTLEAHVGGNFCARPCPASTLLSTTGCPCLHVLLFPCPFRNATPFRYSTCRPDSHTHQVHQLCMRRATWMKSTRLVLGNDTSPESLGGLFQRHQLACGHIRGSDVPRGVQTKRLGPRSQQGPKRHTVQGTGQHSSDVRAGSAPRLWERLCTLADHRPKLMVVFLSLRSRVLNSKSVKNTVLTEELCTSTGR